MNTVPDDAVLVHAPPLRRHMPTLAMHGVGQEDRDGVARMLRARVGGEFWAPAPAVIRPVIVTASAVEQHRHGQARMAALLDHVLRHVRRSKVVLVTRHRYGAAARMARRRGVAAIYGPVDPHALLDGAREVHGLGMGDLVRLAALRGLRAICYGATLDARPVRLEECVHDLTVRTAYVDPFDGARVPLGRIVDILSLWRGRILSGREISVCVGMALWKRERIGEFLPHAPGRPAFRRSAAAALRVALGTHGGGAIAGWATRLPEGMVDDAQAAGVPLWRVEDGFVRSVGLGSDLCVPCSIFVDRRGIYYDPSGPSDLEHILATTDFDEEILERAGRLIRRMVDGGVSKYGRADTTVPPPAWDAGARQVLLVPGQVADDLSVRAGGGKIQGNLELLRAVRAHNPDAFIIYRPHPDVDAGHRAGHMHDEQILQYADRVSRGGAITTLMMQVDEIHTLTSLAGFEGLLRGCSVATYGVPFYAGWGLTRDLGDVPCVRRNRSLSIKALVAGTLLLYPLYMDPLTRLPCEVETLLGRFGDRQVWRVSMLTRLRQLQGKLARSVRKKKQ